MDSVGDRFLRDIEPCINMWRFVDIRAQAVRHPSVGWRCESFRAVLVPYDKKIAFPGLPKLPDLLVVHEMWPIDRLAELVSMLQTGELELGGERIIAKRDAGNNTWQPISTFWLRTYDRGSARTRYDFDWKAIVLTGYEGTSAMADAQLVREMLDARLQGESDPPWDGIADVRRSFIGMPPDEVQRYDLASFEVVAPIMARFGLKTALDESNLILDVEFAPTADLKKARVSAFFTYGDETVYRLPIRLDEERPLDGKDHMVVSVPIPGPCSGANCVLTYGGVQTDRRLLLRATSLTEHPHWAAFQAAVGGPEELLNALQTADGGDPFEHAVATLFHLLGFATGHFGQNTFRRGGDMADIVAFPPDQDWCLVIECTVRELDPGSKIAKLLTRTRDTEKVLPGVVVQPVLVIRHPRSDISKTARVDAADGRVALVTTDDLDGLVQLATEIPSSGKVKGHILRLVPSPTSVR